MPDTTRELSMHQSLKRRMRPMISFKSGAVVLEGIKVAQMIRQQQFATQVNEFE